LYNPFLRRTIRRRAHRVLRKLYDTTDLLQSVWLAFFLNVLPHQTFETPQQLMQLLNRLARNKLLNTYRYHDMQKRSLSREVPLESPVEQASRSDPTQEEPWRCLALWDELEQVLNDLPERDRAVVNALRLGDKPEEAALRFGISVRKVWRILQACRRKRAALCA
jgi:RNA polymerase sigma factor (sigma-70 family)